MKTILIVEDHEDIRELYGRRLRREGYTVREAGNGQEALELLQQMHGIPCLVLLDLMMPVMSGPELLEILHESHRLASLPVVVLSASGDETGASTAQGFMRKPVDFKILLAMVEDFCGSAAAP